MRRIATLTTVLMTTLGLAACSQQEADVVDRALTEPIRSAQVALTVDLAAPGGMAARVSMDGPFAAAAAPDQLERFDWTVRADVPGRSIGARVVSSGRNVFVSYEGETYALGAERVAALVRQGRAEREQGPQVDDLDDVQRLGVDLQAWFPESDTTEESEVAGQPTTRVSGRMDISVVLRDLRRLLRRPELRDQIQGRVPDEAFDELGRAISDPRFRLEAGREDGKLRALSGSVRVRSEQGSASVRFGLTLRAVDRPVQIQAPASGKPIDELLRKLGAGRGERELATAAG
jgi:hypothetical protein